MTALQKISVGGGQKKCESHILHHRWLDGVALKLLSQPTIGTRSHRLKNTGDADERFEFLKFIDAHPNQLATSP
jgi:hypothetical protein